MLFPGRVFVRAAEITPATLSAMRLLDVRYSLDNPKLYGITEHKKARPAGSRFVDLDEELCAHLADSTARHPLPPAEHFVAWCTRRGIGDRPVLCFDDQSGAMAACRLWWMLDAVGVEAYVLDGGVQAYRAAGLPEESGDDASAEAPLDWWPHRRHYAKAVDADDIPANATVVDARFAIRFHSTVRPYGLDGVPGHIPGAVNIPWNSHIDETSTAGQRKLHPEDTIRANMQRALGSAQSVDNMVFTCASGVTACINIALARHLGLGTPSLYAGAWSEYQGRHRLHLQRDAMDKHGFVFVMKTKNLGMNPKFSDATCTVVLDGKSLSAVSEAPAVVQSAVAHLHLGEAATLLVKDGSSYEVEICAKAS